MTTPGNPLRTAIARVLRAGAPLTVAVCGLAAATVPEPVALVTQTTLDYASRPGFARSVVFPGTTSRTASSSEVFPSGVFWEGYVEAGTLPAPPTAKAVATTNSWGVSDATGRITGGGYPVFARSVLEYDYLLKQTGTPPVALPPSLAYPVTLTAKLKALAAIDGAFPFNAAFARAYLVVDNYNSPRVVAHAPDGDLAQDETMVNFGTSLELGQKLDVLLFAEAQSVASAGPSPPERVFSIAEAVADPVIAFNQSAFDEIARMHGFETFNLNDYFEIAYSPGIGPAAEPVVPEPGSAVLVLLGLGSLATGTRLATRRRPRQRASQCRDAGAAGSVRCPRLNDWTQSALENSSDNA